jgi:DNA-binding NtrC family response regulator
MVASGDAGFRKQVLAALAASRHNAVEAEGGADALLKLELGAYAGLVLDRQLPDLDAHELAGVLAAQYPQLPVEMLDSAVPLAACLRAGAPTANFRDLVQMMRLPRPAAAALAANPAAAPPLARDPEPMAETAPPVADILPGFVGASAHLGHLSALVRMVASRRTSVLVLGETGTGKEMIAQALHQESGRAQRPFVVVNCAAIPEALLESELFGFSRGAFTGAVQTRAGRIAAAHTGTLFLDEIGELPLGLQAKLLRFLQQRELQKLGSNDTQRVDVRVIAATNQDLVARVEAGEFRRDLYYRLAVFPIELQPLRDRPVDILPLARHFLHLAGQCARAAACARARFHSRRRRAGTAAVPFPRRRGVAGEAGEWPSPCNANFGGGNQGCRCLTHPASGVWRAISTLPKPGRR